MMKRILLLLLALAMCLGTAAAETLGYGYVNARDVALRREPGGKVVVRVPQDACVWIADSKTDSKGRVWYRINTGLNIDHANYDCEGWMMAEFVDCGDALWHDVTAVSCSPESNGMMALFRDGAALTASRPVVSADGSCWTGSRRMTAQQEPVNQALVSAGLNFFSLDQQGTLYHCWHANKQTVGTQFRVVGGTNGMVVGVTREGQLVPSGQMATLVPEWIVPAEAPSAELLRRVKKISFRSDWVLMLTDTEELLTARYGNETFPGDHPDWTAWHTAVDVDTGFYCTADQRTIKGQVFAAVKPDGTALIYPAELQEAARDWQDLKELRVGQHFLLGLKKDGTALTVSTDGRTPPDVSAWRDVDTVSAGTTYCVGVKRDGTLVFAGDVTFMGEGHTRR